MAEIKISQKDIIRVARRLFSEHSYLGVSMSDIAEKLNITKAALYYHFTGKAEIYKKVLEEVFANLNLSIMEAFKERTTDKKLRQLIKNYLDFGLKEKNLIKALMFKLPPHNTLIKKYIIQLREKIAKLIQSLIEEILKSKKPKPEANSQLITSVLIGLMDGLLLEYSFRDKKIDLEKAAAQIINILFRSI
jgi:AcrR family transcriptional regulator